MKNVAGAFLALTALLSTACGTAEPPAAQRSAAWRSLPAAPLSPREGAHAFWTGKEAVILGGSDARPCPPTASCLPADKPPLADGAAFDPRLGWRSIADAPVGVEWAQSVVIGETVYLWVPGSPGRPGAPQAFLAYRIANDRWESLPLPRHAARLQGIARIGPRLVAYSSTDEHGESPDLVFDPASRSWTELPDDPLSPSFDRFMASSGRELILFEHELVDNPGSEKPAVTRAAAFDPETQTWRRLPDSEILGTGPWFPVRGRLVNPVLGSADGGEVNGWGRAYPYGGILDPEEGEWSQLPSPPRGEDAFGSGILTAAGGRYFGYRGWILNTTSDTWIAIPSLDGEELVTGRTVVAAGADLLVFAGVRWADGLQGELLDDAWAWSPPFPVE